MARWDSEDGPETWRPVLEKARGAGIRLLYVFAKEGIEVDGFFLKKYGGLLADTKLVYSQEIDIQKETYSNIIHFKQKYPSPRLLGLSLACGQYSRFRLDEKMPKGAFEKMYCTWMERAVSGEMADVVLVAGSEDAPQGVLTLKVAHGVAGVGLLGVHADHRGKGIGTHLLRTAKTWAHEAGAAQLTITTQKANVAACQLYEKEGMQVEGHQQVFHFWL